MKVLIIPAQFCIVLCLTMPLQVLSLSSFLGSSTRLRYVRPTVPRCFFTRTSITMMPEGPEVRTLVDQLQGGVGRRLLDINFLSGRYVRNGKPNGFKEFASTMTPLPTTAELATTSMDIILSWNAKGKFIYIILDDGGKGTSRGQNRADYQRSM